MKTAVKMKAVLKEVLHEEIVESIYLLLAKEGLTSEVHKSLHGRQLNTFINSVSWDIAEKVELVLRTAGLVKLEAPSEAIGLVPQSLPVTLTISQRELASRGQNRMIMRLK